MGKESEVSILILTHRQADPDALCAAAGLLLLLEKVLGSKLKTKIVAPQGASTLGKSICDKLGIQFDETLSDEEIGKAELLIAVDVGDSALIQPLLFQFNESSATKVLVDHHGTSNPNIISSVNDPSPRIDNGSRSSQLHVDYAMVEKEATSTCEVVARSFPSDLIDRRISEILLVGLLFDSQHLGIARVGTLEAALKLLRAGAEIETAKAILRTRPDRSEILARVKASQRLRYVEYGKYLILYTEVSSFQASVARVLLDIGGDVGIAVGLNDKEARISIRCTHRFFKETGIDLGEMLSEVSNRKLRQVSLKNSSAGISGGGHSTAASITSIEHKPDELLDELLKHLKARIPQ